MEPEGRLRLIPRKLFRDMCQLVRLIGPDRAMIQIGVDEPSLIGPALFRPFRSPRRFVRFLVAEAPRGDAARRSHPFLGAHSNRRPCTRFSQVPANREITRSGGPLVSIKPKWIQSPFSWLVRPASDGDQNALTAGNSINRRATNPVSRCLAGRNQA